MLTRSIIVACCLFAGAVILHSATKTDSVRVTHPLGALPLHLDEWRGQQGPPIDQASLAELGVDDFVNRVYTRTSGAPVALYVGYYRSQREGDTIHSPLNCLPGNGWEPISRTRLSIAVPGRGPASEGASVRPSAVDVRAKADGISNHRLPDFRTSGLPDSPRQIEVNRLVIQKGMDRDLVLYWYQSHGRVTASEYWDRLFLAFDAIRWSRTDGALVRVIAPIDPNAAARTAETSSEKAATSFVQKLFPVLSDLLPK